MLSFSSASSTWQPLEAELKLSPTNRRVQQGRCRSTAFQNAISAPLVECALVFTVVAPGVCFGGHMSGLGWLLFFGTLGISLWASWRVKAAYAKYSQFPTSSGLSGAEVAARIMQAVGIRDVQIVESNEFLGDHYDPINKRLVLSSPNFQGNSCAAVGVAAHETGHAIQHQTAYLPLNWRMAATHSVGYANMAVTFLPFLGIMTGMLRQMLLLTCIAWGVIMLFNLITLPVEFDASNRAKRILREMGFIRTEGEATAVNRVLNAAALTYVAAFLTSLGYLLWFLLPLLGGRRN